MRLIAISAFHFWFLKIAKKYVILMVLLPESVCYNNQYKGVNTAIILWGLLQAAHSTFDSKNCKQVCPVLMVHYLMSICNNNQYQGVNTAIMRWGSLQSVHLTLISKNCKRFCYYSHKWSKFDWGSLPILKLESFGCALNFK